VKRILNYLLGTKDKSLVIILDINRGLESYIDADFAGAYDKENLEDIENVLLRTGYIIKYTNFPILWVSKLQLEIALSTIESKYIALSTALRDVIPLIGLLEITSSAFGL